MRKKDTENRQAAESPEIPEGINEEMLEETAESPVGENEEKSEAGLLREERDKLNDRYLRLMAEYENFRKRSQKEKDDIYPSAAVAAVTKFLPLLDSLDRASQFERSTEEFAKGFDMILQSFRDLLSAMGVEEVGEVGEQFDPAFHNAAMHIEDENLGENVVSQVFQKGYKMNGKVIRYAMVQTAN